MSIAKKAVCLSMGAIGLLGCWFVTLNLLRMGSAWSDHVHESRVESGPRIIPKEKLETLSKENLVTLVRVGEMVLGTEYRVSRTGYEYLVVIRAVALISTVFLTTAFLWGIALCRRRRSAGTGSAPSGDPPST